MDETKAEEPTEKSQPTKFKFDRLALFSGLVIFFGSLLFRILGMGWGLPGETRYASLHPDEPIIAMYSQRIQPAKFNFTPGFYNYGTLYLTALKIGGDVALTYSGANNLPEPKSVEEALQQNAQKDRAINLAGRVISLIAGSAIPWVVFLLLYKRTHVFGAYAAAAVASFAPGLVVHSRFQTVDVLACLFLTLSLLYAVRLFDEADEKDLKKAAILCGVFAGLSAGTKYTGILALFALAAVAVLSKNPNRWKWLGIGTGAALLAFFVATPGALFDSSAFWRDFKYEMTHTATGHGTVFSSTAPGFIYHLQNLVFGLGLLAVLIGAAGLVRAIWKKHAWAIALIAFAIPYYILIGRAEVKFLRYVFPLIPVLAVGCGWLFGQAHTHPNSKVKIVGMFVLLAIGGWPRGGLIDSFVSTAWMAGADPRESAAEWLKVNAKDKTVGIVSDPWYYTPSLYPGASLGPQVKIDLRSQLMEAASVVRYDSTSPERYDWDKRLLTETKPDFVVFSSFESDDMARINQNGATNDVDKLLASRFSSFMDELRKDYENEPAALFGFDGPVVHDLMYIRPKIWIWKRRTDSSPTSKTTSTPSTASGGQATTPSPATKTTYP